MRAPHKAEVSETGAHLDRREVEFLGPVGDNVALARIAQSEAYTRHGFNQAYVWVIRQTGNPVPDAPSGPGGMGPSNPNEPGMLATTSSQVLPSMPAGFLARFEKMEAGLAQVLRHFERVAIEEPETGEESSASIPAPAPAPVVERKSKK